MKNKRNSWVLYILQCGDNTLYTGITNDLDARLAKHKAGKGAKYTRGRGVLEIVYSEPHRSKGDALKRELAIKAFSKAQKLALCGRS